MKMNVLFIVLYELVCLFSLPMNNHASQNEIVHDEGFEPDVKVSEPVTMILIGTGMLGFVHLRQKICRTAHKSMGYPIVTYN